ncbi:uncharacterized protein LY89DRAFT_617231 [Mollisia scopiformis]|uniref:Glycosyltransferase 2 n=1 Tax=Mollisia scopiformis TaxID=149040 RepID=A0A194X8S3_MOLSC|nr:uncharacterized protein LY89DRAFT_617231 [Mollisia scopiformis]KUJ16182.1 hypothetical protein LY89DRAFT_617231 [Mollisia scopiformis]
MPVPQRRFHGDEELGKKDDDHKPGVKGPMGRAWQQRRLPNGPRRSNLKRIALGFLVVIGFYYFFKNMPTDLEQPRQRPSYVPPSGPNAPASKAVPNRYDFVTKTAEDETPDAPLHNFNGPIKFYQLASTLHGVKTRGSDLVNQNVLFAAASLKSAANLLPIACDTAIRARNYVHFALMGRDDISMDILRSVNGIGNDCNIVFHDARPDFSVQSSDWRMEVSSAAAFKHINDFVNPQATFVDSSGDEETWFSKGLKQRAGSLGRTVIELPENAEQNLMWITLLDSSSLSAWNKVSINIIIHAQPSASGSLIRLLESLKKADFFASSYPPLTIELPHDVDEPSKRYLERFKWPPKGDQSGSLLTLRHRIPQHSLNADESSARFLEGFWPNNPSSSHVLVLSPQVELSPLFYHYLKYTMLEYKYASNNPSAQNLLSLSLDLPSTYLNDTASFTPPSANSTVGGNVITTGTSQFLWQAPNSNAALFFGDKWVELHDFVAESLESQRTLPTPTTLNEKLVSKTYPSWMEHVLRLARARGYWTIYPSFETEDRLATLHNDLYQPPEEYSEEVNAEIDQSDELTADPDHYLSLKHSETSLIKTSILTMLPNKGDLPKVWDMPLLSWDGEQIVVDDFHRQAVNYSNVFRREIGGCGTDDMEKVRVDLLAGDLFCLKDQKT